MTTDDKVEKMRDQFNMDIKCIYKTITKIKVNLGILMDSVKKLNTYTHERIHKLLNTDKGIEVILIRMQERINSITADQKNRKDITKEWKNRTIDAFFRIFSSTILILIGMAFEGHWFR